MKKRKYNLFNTIKNKKIERDFLNTDIGKIMFIILTVGIIAIIIGFSIAIFEAILLLINISIKEYSFLINLGTISVIFGLVCNIIYYIAYTNYRNK